MTDPTPHAPPQRRTNEDTANHEHDADSLRVMLTTTIAAFNTANLPCLDVRPTTGTCYVRETHRPLTAAEKRQHRGAQRRSTGMLNPDNLCPACRLYVAASLALADFPRWSR